MQEGYYKPFMEHTDDYPVFGYQVDSPAGTLSFYTVSQNSSSGNKFTQDNLPWAVYFNKREFVVNSPLASQALGKLRPYLHEEVIQGFSEAGWKTPNKSTLSTPPAPLVTQGTLAQIFPELATLPNVANFRFNYAWQDKTDISVVEYNLTQGPKQYKGEGIFDGYITSKKIAIPNSVVHDFLQSFLQIHLEKGVKPSVDQTPMEIELFETIGTQDLYISIFATKDLTIFEINYGAQFLEAKVQGSFQAFTKIRPYLEESTMKDLVHLPPDYNGLLFSYP
jgi:hypothetical protein